MTHNKTKIVLLGYMASGKSTIGEQLATALQIDFIDLDLYISQQENMTITQIFDVKGEVFFRKKEISYLNEILNQPNALVLSLGGGTPTLNGVMENINEKSISFYLKTSINELAKRLKPKKTERPMIAQIADEVLEEYIAVHLFERNLYYSKADFTVITDNKTESEIVAEIKTLYADSFLKI